MLVLDWNISNLGKRGGNMLRGLVRFGLGVMGISFFILAVMVLLYAYFMATGSGGVLAICPCSLGFIFFGLALVLGGSALIGVKK